jgi:hypothetical protein
MQNPRMTRRRLEVRAALFVTFCSLLALAGGVPPPLRSAIIVRAAGYERGFADRSGEAVIAVVQHKAGAGSDDGQVMAGMFTKLLKETRIAGRRGRVVQVVHESNAKTIEQLRTYRAEVIYFAAGLESVVSTIPIKEAGIARILVCATGSDVGQGCTLGVDLAGEKPQVVINMKQVTAAGLRFDPSLLKLARVVR